MYPMRHKFSEEKLHPKEAVPKNIVEAGNWHWDSQKKDHNDGDSLMGNVDYDWAELEAWSLHFARQYGTPQKWWRMDFETGVIYHSTDSVNDFPIYEQARQHFEFNGFNEHNTQYFKVKDADLGKHFEPLQKMFGMQDQSMSLFVQMPGHSIPSHCDTFSSFLRSNPAAWGNFKTLERYMIFVNDWDWGQFFHLGNHVMQPWTAGDLWRLPTSVYHGSANAGINPKITLHWSGNTPEGTSALNEINLTNARTV
jgi:hypothetical protein